MDIPHRRLKLILSAVLSAAPVLSAWLFAVPARAAAAARARRVIVVSIDGLKPEAYLHPRAHGLRIPVLSRLKREGAYSPGALPLMPAVTYPSHTSMATGDDPGRHGIVANLAWDPRDLTRGDWRWFTEDIKVPTIWQLAYRAGMRTALVSWPVTVGARATDLFPEFWRSGGPPEMLPDDLKLLRALSTPGFLNRTAAAFPGFYAKLSHWDGHDVALTDLALEALKTERPRLLMLHLVEVDHNQHHHGLWSAQANAAIEEDDTQVGRLIRETRALGLERSTLFLVVSDHGFADVSRALRPGVLLRKNGLVSLDAKGRVKSWKAVVLPCDGAAYLYLKSPQDAATKKKILDIFRPLAGASGSGILRLADHAAIVKMGGDPKAFLALEAAKGWCFLGGYRGALSGPSPVRATHGYFPDDPAMRASLIAWGPSIRPGRLKGAKLIDVGPTAAAWLGLTMPGVQGRALRLP